MIKVSIFIKIPSKLNRMNADGQNDILVMAYSDRTYVGPGLAPMYIMSSLHTATCAGT